MGLLNWMKKGVKRVGPHSGTSLPIRPPTFEQLEPRVLLSADAFSPAEVSLSETPFEAAIVVDLYESETHLNHTTQDLEPRSEPTEDQITETQTGGNSSHNPQPATSSQTGLTVSRLVTAATLSSAVSQNELSPSQADASEGLIPTTDGHQPSTDATSGSIVPRGPPTEIVFIDSSLYLDFQLENAYQQGVVVSVFDVNQDGINHITNVLSSYTHLSAIHILSHGVSGSATLGTAQLNAAALKNNSESIRNWGDALTADGDILLYGCNLAQGAAGRALVSRIAELTDADVAASDDVTGSARLAGDWDLEFLTGAIEAGLDLSVSGFYGVLAVATYDAATDQLSFVGTALADEITISSPGVNRLQLDVDSSDSISVTLLNGATAADFVLSNSDRTLTIATDTSPISHLDLLTQNGSDVIVIDGATTLVSGSLDGGGGTDTLQGPNALTSWLVTGAGAGSLKDGASVTLVEFTGIETLAGGT
ncbi:MAG: DUF4347 domain-containing protein, partial [Phycisphaeraceae bacterium]|nr:DUF4347 domain-containing protein [Phycisphaeraceae bacterium]